MVSGRVAEIPKTEAPWNTPYRRSIEWPSSRNAPITSLDRPVSPGTTIVGRIALGTADVVPEDVVDAGGRAASSAMARL